MYHALVRKKIRENFANLGSPDANSADEGLDPNIEHVFGGDDNAIGGVRHTAAGFEQWVKRVYRIFPDLKFTIRNIVVNGWPWDTRVAVEWRSEATTATGERYANDGMHFIVVKLGSIKSMHVYLNTALVRETLAVMADKGFAEAAEPPITR